MQLCIVPDCLRNIFRGEYCAAHTQRLRRGQDLNTPIRVANGEWGKWYNHSGYWARKRTIHGKRERQFQHRMVMEKKLGRSLQANENVHHINGNTIDNRPENLELWVSMQPSGQRPEDLVAYAKEILRLYDN